MTLSQRESAALKSAMQSSGYKFAQRVWFRADADVSDLMVAEETAERATDGTLRLTRDGWESGCKMLSMACSFE
mgnify:CR=1 FL=1